MDSSRYPKILIGLIFGCAVLSCVSIIGYLGVNTYLSSKPKIFSLLDGFEGHAMVIWDQPDGVPAHFEDGVQIFEIPSSGLLLTQSSRPQGGIGDDFWYRDENGQLTEKLIFNQTCAIPIPDDPRVVCLLMETLILNNKFPPRHISFLVGPQSKRHELAEGFFEWRYQILLPRLRDKSD
jgi:hypothetical protein